MTWHLCGGLGRLAAALHGFTTFTGYPGFGSSLRYRLDYLTACVDSYQVGYQMVGLVLQVMFRKHVKTTILSM